ncbi:MAG: glycosyltransferase family 9 protein [Candidatus Binatia bacterium]
MRSSVSVPRRLLLVKPSSFGDIVNALPALSALRHGWPETAIDWIVKPQWAPLLKNHPMLHEVLPFPGNLREWRQIIAELRRRAYDMVIDLQGLFRTGFLGVVSGSRARAGFAEGREGSGWLYTHPVPTSGASVHVVERNLEVIRALGIPTDGVRNFTLAQDPEAEEWVERSWAQEQIKADEIVCLVHPGTRRETKLWPVERFAALLDRLTATPNYRVVLIGGDEERNQFARSGSEARARSIDLMGRTTLPQLVALTRRATVLVTNDSGPMHLAAALGIPVVALFGPTDPRRVGPYGGGHTVLRKDVDCSRCSRHRCVKDSQCMKAIEVDEVYAAVTGRSKRTAGSGRQASCEQEAVGERRF